jgi:hypothetical protein
MRKKLACGFLALAIAVALAPGGAAGKALVVRAGNLFFVDNGGITPSTLPRHRPAPISAHINGKLGTTDGSHPPAVRTVNVDLDRTIQVNADGLPSCRIGQLEARTTAAAKQACPEAIVGTGEGDVEVAFPEQAPFTATGPIVMFNGGVHGGATLLFIHAYVAVPAPTAVIATVKLTHIHRGRFGLHALVQIPAIAGGSGSPTKYRLSIGRRFSDAGRDQSYLKASCPTGHYFTAGEILFSDGTQLELKHALPCTPAD